MAVKSRGAPGYLAARFTDVATGKLVLSFSRFSAARRFGRCWVGAWARNGFRHFRR